MEDWKVRLETEVGLVVSDWMDEASARKLFGRKKADNRVYWAELIHSPLDGNPDDGEIVVDQFSNRVLEIFGKKVIVQEVRK